MAADQRRKRMNSANVIGFSSREHYRAKRKKLDGALRLRDHISLEWDGNRRKVVSKREQVGLSLRHLREFVDYVPPRRSLLAQVCHVPREIFQLESLSGVLSSEVWWSCLSDGERDYLQQFLPEGIDVEKVVEQLLDGENFHFGNPFLEWGTTVCSGKAHPDQIVSQEECLRAAKRRYYADLEKYHNDIIDSLQMLKEKWESCKDPEKDAVKIWGRSSDGNAHVNGSCQDLSAASESSSLNADDKPCNSDRSGEVQRRSKSSGVEKEKSQSPLIALENVVNVGVKARRTDKLPKHSIQQTDGAKYMSYLKISKKQHQIVTSMKQSGKSIQLKALNRILGNINNLDVQPYGLFEEEEQKKLNAHWLQLVRDLPAAYAIWKMLQSQKRDIINSVGRELVDKLNPLMEDKLLHPAENPLQRHDVQVDLRENDQESLNPNPSGDLAPDDENSGSFGQVNAKNHSLSEASSSDVDQITDSGHCVQVGTYPSQVSSPDCDNGNRKDIEANDYSRSIQSQSLPQASFPSESHPSDLEDTIPVGKNCVPEVENATSDERIPCNTSSHGEELQFLSGGDVWQPVGGIRQSYIGRQAYTPSGGLSIIHHPEGGEEEKNCFVHLESDMPEEVDRRKMLQRKANNSFGSFPNNNQNELLQTLFKGQGVASRTTEQLHSLLNVPLNEEHNQIMNVGCQQEGRNSLMEGSQLPGQFQHQMTAPQALSQDQQRQVDIYGQGSMSENIYSDGRGFLMQRSDWNPSVSQIGITTQSLLNTGASLNQNWQFKSMWTNTNGVGCANQSSHTGTTERELNLLGATTNAEMIIQRGMSSDQSLFSVFSQCSQLRGSRSAFEPESSSDQVVASGNYEMLMGGGTTHVGSSLAQPTNPLDYLSGSNPVTSLMPEDVTWMNNQSRQNPGLHDPLGKLYPRSWNP
ncbi:unnamed protein product [Eruca vesicaria subsp. sativa]|uniref:DEUBAD domain-containing protein n=1 Tax=Eruca vesicaria subsp. sativa TaxID=29727 RepID=A0ABC8IQE7_ERUVS|nr:unnamed protein product [Eruca vesicaria subsp. sativa]